MREILPFRACLSIALTSFAATGVAIGQAFNIDIGPGTVLPSAAYGAVAGQTGQWTRGLRLGSSLTDTSGNATPTNFFTSGTSANLSGVPSTSADEHTLMTSAYLLDSGASNYASIGPLNPGWYDVYLYCWTGTSVNSSNPLISLGTDVSNFQTTPNCRIAWPGQQTLGVTYVRFTVQVQQAGSGIGVVYGLSSDRVAALSGLQIVPVPAPGALMTGAAALALLGKRPRR